MGYFNNTLLGRMVLPRHKLVAGWLDDAYGHLDDAYSHRVNASLEEVFKAFCEQQKSLGFSIQATALLWIAVQINALTGVLDEEAKEWVKSMNRGAWGGLPYLSHSMQREIAGTYIEVSSKHLTEAEIGEIWGGYKKTEEISLVSVEKRQTDSDESNTFHIPQIERDALIALYNSTDGANWTRNTGWLGAAGTEYSWSGVTCFNGNVVGLLFDRDSLRGSIPSELGNLTNLTSLRLSSNSLTGSIPSELGNLTNLTTLSLCDNSLSGIIPSELGNLTNLTYLDLGHNSLSGNIPAELGNLTNLTTLSLCDNSLSGIIPSELGNLTNLTDLTFQSNSLSSIPAELGNLTKLKTFTIRGNSFTGSLPSGLESQSTNKISSSERSALIALYAFTDGANWTRNTGWLGAAGTECSWFGVTCSNGNVVKLALYSNSLRGSIPSELGNLTNLTYLDLGHNSLSGNIPAELGNLTNLTDLTFQSNSLSSIPAELGNLTQFKTFKISGAEGIYYDDVTIAF